MEASQDLARILDHVPVVPLPNVVLFPGVVLPLHVSERRFVELVADVSHGYRYLVVAHLAGPASGEVVAAIGCLARVLQAKTRADGSVDVLLEGVRRVTMLQEVGHPRRYRCFRVTAVPQPSPAQHLAAARQLAQLFDCILRLSKAAAACDRPLVEVLRATRDPLALADILAASLVAEVAQQQAVLTGKTLTRRLQSLVDGLGDAVARLGHRAGQLQLQN